MWREEPQFAENSPQIAGPRSSAFWPRNSGRWAIVVLVLLTSAVLGLTASWWLVPAYLGLMSWLLIPSEGSAREPADRRSAAGEDEGSRLRVAGGTKESLSVVSAHGTDVLTETGLPDPALSTSLAEDEGAATKTQPKSKRGRGTGGRSRSRPRSVKEAPEPEPPAATWIRIGPGKFVRVEAGEQPPPEYRSDPSDDASAKIEETPDPAIPLALPTIGIQESVAAIEGPDEEDDVSTLSGAPPADPGEGPEASETPTSPWTSSLENDGFSDEPHASEFQGIPIPDETVMEEAAPPFGDPENPVRVIGPDDGISQVFRSTDDQGLEKPESGSSIRPSADSHGWEPCEPGSMDTSRTHEVEDNPESRESDGEPFERVASALSDEPSLVSSFNAHEPARDDSSLSGSCHDPHVMMDQADPHREHRVVLIEDSADAFEADEPTARLPEGFAPMADAAPGPVAGVEEDRGATGHAPVGRPTPSRPPGWATLRRSVILVRRPIRPDSFPGGPRERIRRVVRRDVRLDRSRVASSIRGRLESRPRGRRLRGSGRRIRHGESRAPPA